MKWNDEQLKAIYTTNKNIVVSASAGAGKTSILVERLLTLCTRKENPINLDRIIAVTFTDAAAAEMKKRLSKSLNNKLNDGEDIEQIHKQLILLDTAQISTIHSFCLNIIKKYYDVINLNPSMINNILDSATNTKINNTAFEKAFLNYSKNNNILELLNIFSTKIFSLEELKKEVLNIIKSASSVFNPELWYEKARNNYKQINKINDIEEDILSLYYLKLEDDMNDFIIKISTLLNSLSLNEKVNDAHINNLKLFEYHVKVCIKHIQSKDYDRFYEEFDKINDLNFRVSKFSDYEKKLKSEIFDEYKKQKKTLYNQSQIILVNNNLNNVVNQLLDLAVLTSKEIKTLKEKANGVNFDDMEHYAYKILTSNNNMIANQLKEDYDEILIDEFQDTNEIQNEIVNLISRGNNTFRVGDVKQSIYKFRKAKPEIMRLLMNNPDYELISLRNNYRSKENIVNFTNTLFSKLMNINGFSDKYQDIDSVSIGVDSQKDYKKDTIVFYALEKTKDSPLSDNELKANYIANKIKKMVSTDKYKYKDFAILSRGHNIKEHLKKSFDSLNIPYFIDLKSGFYSSWMSSILTSYLKLIIDFNDSISLMSVLTSPLYGLSDQDCANLILSYKTLQNGLFKTNHQIIVHLSKLKDIYKNKGICAVLDYVSLINNFINEKCDNQQRTNFDLFYENVMSFEKNSSNLNEFLSQIDSIESDDNSEAICVGEDEDVVRAMTIHHSKGLQFKVVFFLSTSINSKQDLNSNVLLDSNLGIGLDYIDTNYYAKYYSIQKEAIKYKSKDENAQEYIRLLYVALTRAQEEMYIIDTYKNKYALEKVNQYYVRRNIKSTSLITSLLSDDENFKLEYIPFKELEFKPEEIKTTENTVILPKYKDIIKQDIEVVTPSKDIHELTLDIDLNRSSDAVNRGSLMHYYIETLPNKLWKESEISKIVSLNKNDIESLVSFNKSALFDKCMTMKIYHEYPFILKKGNSLINGIIDLIAIGENEIIIIDFKSDRNVDEEKLKELYTSQIMYYVDSIKDIFKDKKISAYIYSFHLNKEILLT